MSVLSRTFYVFEGSTKGVKWVIHTKDKIRVEAFNTECKIWDKDMEVEIATLDVVREDIGVYHSTISTQALALTEGIYMIRFECSADGNNYVQVDYLRVAKKG